jgi:hypothetical protein
MVGIPYDDLERWRGPFSPDVLARQMQTVAEGWAEGLVELQIAQRLVPEESSAQIESDLRVVQAAFHHFASVANQIRFTAARNLLLSDATAEEKEAAQRVQRAMLDAEIGAAQQLFDLASVDSRLGYEPSNHYFYVPFDLVEKVVNCEYLKSRAQPRDSAVPAP